MHASGRKNFGRIFDKFHQGALSYAKMSSMIYPSSWETSITKGFGKELMESGLKQVDNYNGSHIFGDSITTGYPVSIVLCRPGYLGEISVNGIGHSRGATLLVDSPTKALLLEKTKNYTKLKGISDLLPISNLQELGDRGKIFRESPEGLEKPVSVYLKRIPGTKPDGATFYAEEEDVSPFLKDSSLTEKYKVSMPSSYFKQMRLFQVILENPRASFGFKVFPANHLHGKTWKTFRSFNTLAEAENFRDYVNCRPIVVLLGCTPSLGEFGALAPDLGDYSNNNEIFMGDGELPEGHGYISLTLMERLLSLFGISQEEATTTGLIS